MVESNHHQVETLACLLGHGIGRRLLAGAGGDVDVHATAAGHRKEQPHAPHAASDHKVAQDRVDDDPVPSPSLWLPWIEPVSVPRDMVGVAAGAPPTGPPPVRSQRNPIAARAPPRA